MSKNFDNVVKRCDDKGLKSRTYSPSADSISGTPSTKVPKGIVVQIPEERDFKNIIILDTKEEIKAVEQSQFEKYRFIKSYEAIWSQELETVECEIQTDDIMRSPMMVRRKLKLIFNDNKNDDEEEETTAYEFPSPNENIKIFLGDCSNEFSILANFKRSGLFFSNRIRMRPTIKIVGIKVTTHEEAKSALLKLANAVLFQVDLNTNTPIHLTIDRDLFKDLRLRKLSESTPKLTAPKFEYDQEPMSLYWYARTARNMPLLQYLAFYQILEFYFPQYSYKEAQQKIKNLLKDPRFDVNKENDISQILNIIKVSSKGKTFGDERSQLKATIQNCIDSNQLWDYLNENSERKEFFDIQSKNKSLVKQRISFSNKENDLRIDVSNRIYELRCRIVHTKDEDELDLILPTSSEISLLKFDIELIEFICRQVLIAGGRQLII